MPSSRLIVAMVSNSSSAMVGASPTDGSSSISSLGRATSARPTSSICISPPDR